MSVEISKRMKFTKKIIKEILKKVRSKIMKKKFNCILDGLDYDMDINKCWKKMEMVFKSLTKKILGHEPRIKRKSWFNEQWKEAIAERDKAHLRVVQDPTEGNKRMLAIKLRGKGKKNN